jgi:hypothetical protein
MLVETFTLTHNEELRLPWYLDAYSFADKITIFDNGSTDRTREIAASWPRVEVRDWATDGLDDGAMRDLKNSCWKRSVADWVIVSDVDELLVHPNFPELLRTTTATVLRPAAAYTMISREIPDDYRKITRGDYAAQYIKLYCFRPDSLDEIRFSCGAHEAQPSGDVIVGVIPELICYHYHAIGVEETVRRYRERSARMSANNRARRWGWHYDQAEAKIRAFFDNIEALPEVRPYA